MTDDNWERLFKSNLNAPGRWRENAERLKRGGDLLFLAHDAVSQLPEEEQADAEDRGLSGVATMLYGLAMENILKAALLRTGVARTRPDGSVEWNVEGATQHDLVSMSLSSKLISLDAQETKLLERMSAFVCWAGKYPTPLGFVDKKKKDFKGLLLSDQPGAGKRMLPIEISDDDRATFQALYHVVAQRALGPRKKEKS